VTTATRVLNHARSELGTREDPIGSNRTEYSAEAGHANGYAWCATFLVAMFRRAGLTLPSESAYTPTMANAFKKAKRYGTEPRRGAIGFLYFPSKGRIAHTFVVEDVRPDGRVVTIEGNTNDAGSREGDGVYRRVRSLTNLTFGYPDYDEPPPAAVAAPVEEDDVLLKIGHTGPPVAMLQECLKGWGNYEGEEIARSQRPYAWDIAVDGKYGRHTELAVDAFQRAVGLPATGVADGVTCWMLAPYLPPDKL
jgi:hypothetical protein